MIADSYRRCRLIRSFEEMALELAGQGKLSGTIHTCIGQETIEVGIVSALAPGDVVVSNHRGHGHYLAKTGNAIGLLAEMMGKADGLCGGRGGSQHLHDDNFYTNGVLGNLYPVAAGMALAEKIKQSGNVVCIFIGDGALGQGVVYETNNLASLLRLPLLVVVEDNGYAQTTPRKANMAGSLLERFSAFGLSVLDWRGMVDDDVIGIQTEISEVLRSIRGSLEPRVVLFDTYRLAPHSKGDDFRDTQELAVYRTTDPLRLLRARLLPKQANEIDVEVKTQIGQVLEIVERMQ